MSSGGRFPEYVEVIRILEDTEGLVAYELNISCPNVEHGGAEYGVDPELATEVVTAARKAAKRPLWVKLSPTIGRIGVMAKAVESAGADAVVIANTYPALCLDTHTRMSRLGSTGGGLSGAAIKPITVRLVYEASRVISIPIVGLGGIWRARRRRSRVFDRRSHSGRGWDGALCRPAGYGKAGGGTRKALVQRRERYLKSMSYEAL